jgi:hypothetical protein
LGGCSSDGFVPVSSGVDDSEDAGFLPRRDGMLCVIEGLGDSGLLGGDGGIGVIGTLGSDGLSLDKDGML